MSIKGEVGKKTQMLVLRQIYLRKEIYGLEDPYRDSQNCKEHTSVSYVVTVCAHMWVRVCASGCHHPETHRERVSTS